MDQHTQTHVYDGPDRRNSHIAEHEPVQKGIRFDPSINAGHMLTFAGFIIAGFVAWTTMDKRVTVLEERTAFQTQIDKAQDTKHDTNMQDIKGALNEIKQQVNRVADRVERKNIP